MFNQKKGYADINNEPEVPVRYLGNCETFVAVSAGCTHGAVQRIWDNTTEERLLPKAKISISIAGIILADVEGHQNQSKIDIRNISYCCAEKPPHDRVFSWVCKKKSAKKLECHAVLCSSRDKAQSLALHLNRAFRMAYMDWRNDRERKARQTVHRQRSLGEASTSEKSAAVNDGDKASSSSGSSLNSPVNDTKYEHFIVADGEFELTEAMAQMNIVEEEDLPFNENFITVNSASDHVTT